MCLTADPGVQSHTFVEIDHEIISTAIPLPYADLRRVVATFTSGNYVHKVLVNRLVKLSNEHVWLVELTISA